MEGGPMDVYAVKKGERFWSRKNKSNIKDGG